MKKELEIILKKYFAMNNKNSYYLLLINHIDLNDDESILERLMVDKYLNYYLDTCTMSLREFSNRYKNIEKIKNIDNIDDYLTGKYEEVIEELKKRLN